jgi:hypothetical protein
MDAADTMEKGEREVRVESSGFIPEYYKMSGYYPGVTSINPERNESTQEQTISRCR